MTIERCDNVFIADNARVRGDVRLGENVNIWYAASIRGDVAPVVIGTGTNVQDNAVIHCDAGYANVIGASVTIGHDAIVHGHMVGDRCLIGMGAIILGHSRVGSDCLIAAGAVVREGMEVPDRSVVMGVPGKVVREVSDAELEMMADLPRHYVELARHHADHPDRPQIFDMADVKNAELIPDWARSDA